ncbi:ABC transporter permease subunit [Sediminibacillus dalangtanensis]|uniref:ABC transporter permease subunit n=2 Tax=Sediminibacillus dalangtanensis TaxID=2729421 RepID=A0ABX7VR61_9BACI|nr:ABC transporter permease subunit [Sediminibacillus dalangtanensis]
MKVKRSKIIPILAICPFLIVATGINSLLNYISPETEGAWQAMFVQSCLLFSYYLLPFTMIVVSVLISQREKANKGILKMLTLPVNRQKISMAKFVVFLFFLFLQVVIFFTLFLLVGLYASNNIGLQEPVPYFYIVKWSLIIFFTAIPLVSIIWLLTVMFHKVVLTIGLSVLMVIASVFVANVNLVWTLFPFSYSGKFVSEELSRVSSGISELDVQLFPFIPFAAVITCLCLLLASKRFGKKEMRVY